MAVLLSLRSCLSNGLRLTSESVTRTVRPLSTCNPLSLFRPLTTYQSLTFRTLAHHRSVMSSSIENLCVQNGPSQHGVRLLSMFTAQRPPTYSNPSFTGSLNVQSLLAPMQPTIQQVRTRIRYSRRGGKPRTVKAVIRRFFRLYNGLWIRPMAGRNKRKWKKTPAHNFRLKHHLVCNRAQCQLLDKMVNRHFRLPKYYVEDPYEVYHRKSNLPDYRYQPPKFLP